MMLNFGRRTAATAEKASATGPGTNNKLAMNKRKVLLKDIAKHLGVTSSTVSMALKDHPDLSRATVEKVKKLAAEWHYISDPFTKVLSKQRTNTLGVIVPDITSHFYPSIIQGIEEVAKKSGYDIVIISSQESYQKEKEYLNKLLKLQVDGLLVCLAQETADFRHYDTILAANIPLVFFDRVCRTNEISSVVMDVVDATRELTIHLYEQGATKIAYLAGPPAQHTTQHKIEGYKKGLQACGLLFDEQLLLYAGTSAEAAAHATHRLLSLNCPPDAIIGANDVVILSARKEIQKKGLQIPQDVCLAGYMEEFFSKVVEPPITAVAYPSIEMGREAARLLFGEIESEGVKVVQQRYVPAKPVIRSSSLKTGMHARTS